MGLFDTVKAYKGVKNMFGGKKSGGSGFKGPKVPEFAMRNTSEFIKEEPRIEIGQNVPKRFETYRQNAIGQINKDQSANANALQRRFAAMGASGSGAQLKLQEQANELATRQKTDAIANVDAAEEQAMEQRDAQQADMDFRQKVFSFEKGSKMHELDLAERQQKISSVTEQYNAKLNEFLNKPPKQGLISGLLGDIL
jgi:hypothetical protein